MLAWTACDGGEPESRRVELLASLLPVAEVTGSASVMADGGIAHSSGAVTWYLPIPAGAILRGEVVARAGDTGRARIRLLLRGEKASKSLEWPLAELSEPTAFELDLTAAAGRMAGVRLALHADEGSALEWRELAIVSPPPPPAPARAELPRRDYNVLLVLFDTLRADRTEPYGSKTVQTPEMAKLAAQGTTFVHARANASWTAPSVASLLTGTYASRHGVRGMGAFKRLAQISTLAPSLPYLPELLQARGYTTLAVLNNAAVSPELGFARGFETTQEFFRSREEVLEQQLSPTEQADLVWDRFFEPVLEQSGSAPFFFFLHEIDPHNPYQVPPPFDSMYGTFADVDPALFSALRIHMRYASDPSAVSAREIEYLLSLYAAEVSFMDGYLGRLLERLDAADLRRDTVVVFLSDHGESLTQHGRIGHGDTLYDEVLRVPLILSLPGVIPAGRRVEAPVELVDVAPTVLDLLGAEAPPDLQGRSLLPLLVDPSPPQEERPGFAQAYFGDQFARDAVHYGGWKLIQSEAPNGRKQTELYDLSKDPDELENRWPAESVVGRTLRQMLAGRLQADSGPRRESEAVAIEALDAETQRNLEALGYVE